MLSGEAANINFNVFSLTGVVDRTQDLLNLRWNTQMGTFALTKNLCLHKPSTNILTTNNKEVFHKKKNYWKLTDKRGLLLNKNKNRKCGMIVHETATRKIAVELDFYRSQYGLQQWTRVLIITEAVKSPEIQNVKLYIKHNNRPNLMQKRVVLLIEWPHHDVLLIEWPHQRCLIIV